MSNFQGIAEKIIFDTPPGETEQVFNYLNIITDNKNPELLSKIVADYNINKSIPIVVDNKKSLITEYNKQGSKYFDPIRKIVFSVDHLRCVGLDVEEYDTQPTSQQETIYHELTEYISQTFLGDVSLGVFLTGIQHELAIVIVNTKYNPNNYWNGYWKSKYIYNSEIGSLDGYIDVNVHYYEDGNVNFKSNKKINSNNIEDVVFSIKQFESDFEESLQNGFKDLNETQFKYLRRKLPVTRSKINWGRAIGNYRLGKDAPQSRQ